MASSSLAMQRMTAVRASASLTKFRQTPVACFASVKKCARRVCVVVRAEDASVPDPVKQAVDAAAPAPTDVSPDEFALFYGLLQCADVAEVEKKCLAMIEEGKLTEGVLKAGFATLEQAQARGDEKVIPTLTGLCQYLLEMYQRLAAPPALVLVDQFVQIIDDEEKVLDAMRKALVAKDAPIPLPAFLESVAQFLVAIEQQDVEFENDFKQMGEQLTAEQMEQITQMREMRKGAKAQMLEVQRIAKSLE